MASTTLLEGVDVCGNMDSEPSAYSLSTTSRQSGHDFSRFEERLESFKKWPIGIPVESTDLAQAGLYYTGNLNLSGVNILTLFRYNPQRKD